MSIRFVAVLSVSVALATPTLAKDQCWDRREGEYPSNMFLNMVMTDAWRDSVNQADPQAMAAMAGLWYGEIYAPSLGMVDHQYRSFEPNGLFQYQSQTCGNIQGIPCSENYGTGQWTARQQQDGSLAVMMHFDDLTQSDRCGSFQARLQGNMMIASDGSQWQRTQ
jgi:hypothetical protein